MPAQRPDCGVLRHETTEATELRVTNMADGHAERVRSGELSMDE